MQKFVIFIFEYLIRFYESIHGQKSKRNIWENKLFVNKDQRYAHKSINTLVVCIIKYFWLVKSKAI